jgi:hypothetical protein
MMRLKHRNKVPPGGYFAWKCPKHGTIIKRPSMMRIEMAVKPYCAANKLPQLTKEEIEANVCEQMPDLCYDYDAPPLARQAYNAAMELGKWAAHKFEVADKPLLEQRLSICGKCRFWSGVEGGPLIKGRCGKCGCSGVKLGMATSRCPIGQW